MIICTDLQEKEPLKVTFKVLLYFYFMTFTTTLKYGCKTDIIRQALNAICNCKKQTETTLFNINCKRKLQNQPVGKLMSRI